MKLFRFFSKNKSSFAINKYLQDLEDLFLMNDFGIELTQNLIEKIKRDSALKTEDKVNQALKNWLTEILTQPDLFKIALLSNLKTLKQSGNSLKNLRACQVILNIGTNGVGKTTSCAKLAKYYQNLGYKVALVAADTFRSGAINQLKFWADKHNIYFFETSHREPSAVAYSAIDQLSKNFEIIIVDSAGRSPYETNLMNQLIKLKKIIINSSNNSGLNDGEIECKTLITIDGTNGSEAKEQVRIFSDNIAIDGLIVTKLDGSTKAGVLFSIVKKFNLPIAFITVGEKINDLEVFSAEKFISEII